ncbi:MAG TPA: hypothetical protein VGC41_09285, partial [Kofleriaceae bacterium]
GTADTPAARFGSMTACRTALAKPPSRRYWVLAAIPIAAAAIYLRPSETSTCADAPAWLDRDRVAAQLAPDVLARVDRFVTSSRTAAHEILVGACHADTASQLRARSCVATSWQWISQHLSLIAAGNDVPGSLDELPAGTPIDRCAPGGVAASPPAINAAATPLSKAIRDAILVASAHEPHAAITELAALGPTVTAIANPGLSTVWHFERARSYDRAGDRARATAEATAAADLATRNGDDLALARARLTMYMDHDVGDRTSTVRDAELESLMIRTGSPGMLAAFHDVAGQRALGAGDLSRAKQLFEQTIAAAAALELAPSAEHGIAEQNLGTTLRYAQDPKGAQPHLDRAVQLLTARFGPHEAHTLQARMAAAHNQMFLGNPQESARAFTALASDAPPNTTIAADIALAQCQLAQLLADHALERCKASLELARTVYGANSPSLVAPLSAFAQLTMRTSVHDALPYLEEAFDIARGANDHPNDLPYVEGLYALALSVEHRDREAVPLAREALPGLDRFGQKDLAAAVRQRFKL